VKLQNCEICNLGILGLPFRGPRHFSHFNVVFPTWLIIHYKEEEGGLLPSLGHVNVLNPKQVHDPKLTPFPLTSCIV